MKRIAARALPQPPWHYTDDTMMALSIVSVLRQSGAIDQNLLARSFAERYERARGYGPATSEIACRCDSLSRPGATRDQPSRFSPAT
ncbi:MAG: ADP-ribosylglycohydrolase family protein [Roseiflexaceae bacterium]